MKAPLFISAAAYEDIKEARKWYEKLRVGLSFDFDLCLEGGYEDIRRDPLAYQIKYKNVRVKYVARFPYGIHYLMEEGAVYVLGIFHMSRSPRKWRR